MFVMDNDIRIYFDDRVVVLTDKNINICAIDKKHLYVFEDKKALVKRLKRFEQSNDEQLYVIHYDLNELFGCVKKCFKYVEAGGGAVLTPDGRVLLIKRLGKWDLPKGKVEKGESLQDTALREVAEECGLKKTPEIIGELAHTFHTYRQGGKHILKHTAWYTMLYDGDEELQPQYDEDITEATWLPKNMLNGVMQNTYQSIKQVLLKIQNSKFKIQN